MADLRPSQFPDKYNGYVLVDDAQGSGRFLIDNLFGDLAPNLDETSGTTHLVDSLFMRRGILYKVDTQFSGSFDATKCTPVSLSQIIDLLSSKIKVIGTPLQWKGSKTVAQLNTVDSSIRVNGYLWTVSDEGTITDHSSSWNGVVSAGDEVAWTNTTNKFEKIGSASSGSSLPILTDHALDFLRVKSDASGVEWAAVDPGVKIVSYNGSTTYAEVEAALNDSKEVLVRLQDGSNFKIYTFSKRITETDTSTTLIFNLVSPDAKQLGEEVRMNSSSGWSTNSVGRYGLLKHTPEVNGCPPYVIVKNNRVNSNEGFSFNTLNICFDAFDTSNEVADFTLEIVPGAAISDVKIYLRDFSSQSDVKASFADAVKDQDGYVPLEANKKYAITCVGTCATVACFGEVVSQA